MKRVFSDTYPEAERFHIELIRKAPIFRRLQMVASLTKTMWWLSWQGMCERYPDETPEAKEAFNKMKPPDIVEVTFRVVKAFEKLGIAYHIGGSLASSAFGVARATLDVDIVADIKLEQASLIEESLKEEFYVDGEMIRSAIQRQASFNLIHLGTMFKVDVFVLKNRPFDKQAFSRRFQKPVSEDSSQQLFFATPEDVILNKLEWYKAGGEVADHQWNDILGVLKVQGREIDLFYLNRWAKEMSVSNLLKRAIDEARDSLA
jgi:hypothetical protein